MNEFNTNGVALVCELDIKFVGAVFFCLRSSTHRLILSEDSFGNDFSHFLIRSKTLDETEGLVLGTIDVS